MARKPPQVIVSIDLGGSLTKVCVQTLAGEHHLLGIKSEVAKIPPNSLKEMAASSWGETVPEANIWVATMGENPVGYAVGNFAKSHFLSESDLKVSKLDRAVPKILGVLSVLQQKLNLPKRFSAVIGILLPSSECSTVDREDLADRLRIHLKGFTTAAGKLSVSLKSPVIIKPEGAGLLVSYKNHVSPDYFMKKRVGILGIGYRNSNLLVMHQGSISKNDRHTSNLGFSTFLEAVRSEIGSTVEADSLASFVSSVGFETNKVYLEQYLRKIGKSSRLDSVARAISRSRTTYLHQLQEWFKLSKVDSIDTMVFYGGTIEYFRSPFKQYFARLDRVIWHGDVVVPSKLLDTLLLGEEQTALNYRFVDPWCYLHYLAEGQPEYEGWGLSSLTLKGVAEATE